VTLAVAALLLMAAGPGVAQTSSPQMVNRCDPGDRIDGSTMPQAKRRIEAAGYRDVRGLRKGCDNYWHGIAVKDQTAVNVLLTPDGQVMTEGN